MKNNESIPPMTAQATHIFHLMGGDASDNKLSPIHVSKCKKKIETVESYRAEGL
jgi:hypothetical protein